MAGFLLQYVGFSCPRGAWQNSIAVFLGKMLFACKQEEYMQRSSWVQRANGYTVRAFLFSDSAWMCNMCNISPRTALTSLEMPEQQNVCLCSQKRRQDVQEVPGGIPLTPIQSHANQELKTKKLKQKCANTKAEQRLSV